MKPMDLADAHIRTGPAYQVRARRRKSAEPRSMSACRREAVIERDTRDRPLAAIATLFALDARAFVRTPWCVGARQEAYGSKEVMSHDGVGNMRSDNAGPRFTWVMPRKPAHDEALRPH